MDYSELERKVRDIENYFQAHRHIGGLWDGLKIPPSTLTDVPTGQWGTATIGVLGAGLARSVAVTFPTAFANAPRVFCTANGVGECYAAAHDITVSGFYCWTKNTHTGPQTVIVAWFALGT